MPRVNGVHVALLAQGAFTYAAESDFASSERLHFAKNAFDALCEALRGDHPRCQSADIHVSEIVRQTTLLQKLCQALQLLQRPPLLSDEPLLPGPHELAVAALHLLNSVLDQMMDGKPEATPGTRRLIVQQVQYRDQVLFACSAIASFGY